MKKGFTLIEVLAVIIILGIVVSVAASVTLDNIYYSRKVAFVSSCSNMAYKAEEYVNENSIELPKPDRFIIVSIADLEIKNKNQFDTNSVVVIANHGDQVMSRIKYYVYAANDYFISNGINYEYMEKFVMDKSTSNLIIITGATSNISIWSNYYATADYSTTMFTSLGSRKTFSQQ